MVRPIRRIVAGNDDSGKAVVLSDGPSPDVKLDPARPGFASTRLWVTDASPARVAGIRETLYSPHRLEPPPKGSLCRFVEFPPEKAYIDKIKPSDVAAWFASVDAAEAHVEGPHPYMQRTRSLDLCYVLEGEIVLVLDSAEVRLAAGSAIIINGARHAWSNRSDTPAIIILSQHAGVDEIAAESPSAPVDKEAPAIPENASNVIRRVVVGTDAEGRSCVIYDGPVPNIFGRPSGSFFYELWTLDEAPAQLDGNVDAGRKGRTVAHSPPAAGANWRISYSASRVPKTAAKPPESSSAKAMDTGGGTQRLEGSHVPGMHRTPSLDYAICLEGDRVLLLEDSEVVLNKGDVVIQCGNWHSWGAKSDAPGIMSYVMIGGEFG
jgi:quercetin dioxygenase-like cupin family protein